MLAGMDVADQDGQLMLRYRGGDLGAFDALYARHKGPLYRYLLRQVHDPATASDLFQEVWSKVIAARHRYEARARFTTYLFHIAHHCAIDHYRRGRTAPMPRGAAEPAAGVPEPQVPEYELPDRRAEFGEQQSALFAALAALPTAQREAFLLREEGGLGVEEIARVTNVGIETAKSRLRYAVCKLRLALADAPPVPRAAVAGAAPARLRAS